MGHTEPLSVYMAIQTYPPELGGCESLAERLAGRLRKRGVQMKVLTAAWRPTPREWLDPNGTPILSFGQDVSPRWKTIVFAAEMARTLVKERHQYQVVHFFLANSHTLVGAPVARALGKGVVVKFGVNGMFGDVGSHQASLKGRLRLGWIKALAHKIVVLNPEMLAEVQALKVPEHKIAMMINGIDAQDFAPLGEEARAALRETLKLPAHRPVMLYTGFFKPQKDLPNLLSAVSLLAKAHPEALLVLAGDGPLRESLEAQVQELGIGEQVRMTGALSHGQVKAFLQASDVFVLASAAEGLSISLLEAMSVGLPVVVSQVPGNAQLVDEGVEGLRVPVKDPQALALALGKLVEDPSLRRALGGRARERVLAGYTIELTAERYEALYRSVCGC